jgi:hypothetical protein
MGLEKPGHRKHDPMTHDEACLHLYGFWMDYLESRGYFLGAGAAVDPKDEAAMIIGSVTPDASGLKTGVLSLCASGLDPEAAAVRGWMDDCVAAARRGASEAVAAAGELVVACSREFRPGLVQ